MKRFIIIISLLITVAILFASCGKDAAETASADPSENTGHAASDESEKTNDDTFDSSLEATGDFTVTPSDGGGSRAKRRDVHDHGRRRVHPLGKARGRKHRR